MNKQLPKHLQYHKKFMFDDFKEDWKHKVVWPTKPMDIWVKFVFEDGVEDYCNKTYFEAHTRPIFTLKCPEYLK